MPSDFMDDTSLCVFYNMLGKKCLFCGMTRAFIHMIHFEFAIAYSFNEIVFLIFPIVCLLVVLDFIKFYKRNIRVKADQ